MFTFPTQWIHSPDVSLVDSYDLWFIDTIDSPKVHPSIGDWHISVLHKKIEERQSACQQNVTVIELGWCYCPLRMFWLFYKQGWDARHQSQGTLNITKDKSITHQTGRVDGMLSLSYGIWMHFYRMHCCSQCAFMGNTCLILCFFFLSICLFGCSLLIYLSIYDRGCV